MRKTISQLREEIAEKRAQAEELLSRSGDDLTGDDAAEFEELARALEAAKAELTAAEESVAKLAEAAKNPANSDSPAAPRRTASTGRDIAMRSLDAVVKRNALGANQAETVEHLLTQGTTTARTWTERWAAAAGDPAYERAFAKVVTDRERGHMTFTPEEANAWRNVAAVQSEQRALGLGSQGGSTMVPLALDPAVILSNNGSNNPLRKIARTVTISSDTWHGVSSAGATAEWVAEATEVADGSPTLTQPEIPTHKYDVWAPYSVEVEGDATNFIAELQKVIRDEADNHTGLAYTVGDGSGEPTGIVTALVASSPTVIISGDGSEKLAASDAYNLQNALGARFQPNASWTAHLATVNTFRQFETDNGALKFPSLQENPPHLLGRPVHENSQMDGSINAAATAANYLLIYGDFSHFVIVDRVGSSVELVPHLFGSNRRPTLQRGILLWGRTGSDMLTDNAFRLLSVATTA